MELTNISLLYGLFNQYVFSEAKMNMSYLLMYYKDKFLYDNNKLIKNLLKLIEDYGYSDLTESRFILTLQKSGNSIEESQAIYKKILDYQSYNKDQAGVFSENLKSVCYSAFVDRVTKQAKGDPIVYVEKLKEFNYKTNYSSTLTMKNFKDLDVTDLVHRYSAEGYKSRYKFVNQAYNCGGYIPGQLVLVCAAPGVGKSLFMQSEAVNFMSQGKRIHYLTMGDMNELDMVIRMLCQFSHKSQREIEADILGNYECYREQFNDCLSMTVVPAGVVSAREYVDWMAQRLDEFDVLFIDYYSNFGQDEGRSMYQNGGDICDCLTELTRAGKLVFMAVQPKISYFGEEFLPYEAVGESSRLIHAADMIITLGRLWKAGMRMGKFNIAKNRRGNPDAETVFNWIGTNDGLFYQASTALYTKYIGSTKKRLYSYNELVAQDILDESIADVLEPTLQTE